MDTNDVLLRRPACVPGWTSFADLHPLLQPPLRPADGDVAAFEAALRGHEANVLMLGITTELLRLGRTMTAADLSRRMIADIWPGDDRRRKAVVADWTSLPFDDASFSAVIGDGSLSAPGDAVAEVLQEVRRVLRPGGVAVFRAFCAPRDPETMCRIRADVENGRVGNFHALKFRVAMVVASASANWSAPVRAVRDAFDAAFPDRNELRRLTGFGEREIATIDFYEHAGHALAFTPLEALVGIARPHFREVRVTPGHGYPLAERCPTLVMS